MSRIRTHVGPARWSPCSWSGSSPLTLSPGRHQPWLQALRREHSIAQDVAQALTPTLVAAYIERFLFTDQAPGREVLETALAAQGPDLVRYLRTWLRRRPIPPRQEAVWQALYHWLQPRLLRWVTQGLEATRGQAHLAALTPAAWAAAIQDYVRTTPCPLAQVAEIMRQETTALVQVLTQALDLSHCTHAEIQALLHLRPIQRAEDRPHPLSPLFLSRSLAPVATGSPMLSSAQALLRQDLWRPDGENVPPFRRLFSQERVIEHYVTKADPTSRTVEALAGEAAWQIVQQFGLPTAFLHIATLLEEEALQVQTAMRETAAGRLQWASDLVPQVLAAADACRQQREQTGKAVLGVSPK